MKSKLRSSTPFGNANVTNEDHHQIAGESRKKLRVLKRKLRDYWTEVHQIWTCCNLIIAIEPFENGLMIGQSVVECRSKE